MVESQTPLATQCLEFCQTLTSKGHAFTFNLTLGSSFSFSLDTKMKNTSLLTKKKKKSPSTMRRNLKRKEDYLKRKEAEERENSTDMEPSSQVKKTFKCSQCDNDFKSENGLKIHIGKAHKSSDPPTEKLRDAILPALKPLVISPIRETRIIHCNNWWSNFTPSHMWPGRDTWSLTKTTNENMQQMFFQASIFKVHSTSLQAMLWWHDVLLQERPPWYMMAFQTILWECDTIVT